MQAQLLLPRREKNEPPTELDLHTNEPSWCQTQINSSPRIVQKVIVVVVSETAGLPALIQNAHTRRGAHPSRDRRIFYEIPGLVTRFWPFTTPRDESQK